MENSFVAKEYPVIDNDYELTYTESRVLFVQSKQLIEYRIAQDKEWHKFTLDNFDPETDTSTPITEKNLVEFAYLDDFFSLFLMNKKDRDYLLVVCEDILYEQLEDVDSEESDEDFAPPPSIIGSVYYDKSSKMWWSYYGFVLEPGGCFKTAEHAARSTVINYFGLNDND